jgi:glutathione S-transferase
MKTEQDVSNSIPQTTENGGTPPRVDAPTKVRVFTIPGSHPGVAVQRMLDYKGVPYRRTDLLPVASWGVLKALGFPGVTVPAVNIDGRKIQGSIEIARELESIVPEPPLFPADPATKAVVEEAERFGDSVLQETVRRILLWSLRRDTAPLRSYLDGSRIGLPHGLGTRMAGPFIALDARSHDATDDRVQSDISNLPGILRQIDDWIAAGVIGGEKLNVADFQLAPSLRLAMSLDDIRPAIEDSPAGDLALRVVPDYPGRVPPVLPDAWLEPLRDSG